MRQLKSDMNHQDDERRQERIRQNQAAIELLNEWEQEDAEEQRETWAFLSRSLEEDPLLFRRVFP